jgi:hypothetical protein
VSCGGIASGEGRLVAFGAICPAHGVGAALALPHADMTPLHLDEFPAPSPGDAPTWISPLRLRQIREDVG